MEKIRFPVQLTASRIGSHSCLIQTLLYVMAIQSYIHNLSSLTRNRLEPDVTRGCPDVRDLIPLCTEDVATRMNGVDNFQNFLAVDG